MAIIKCPECRKKVSSSALSCPACGFGVARWVEAKQQARIHSREVANRRTKKFLGYGGLFFVGFIMLGGLFGSGEDEYGESRASSLGSEIAPQMLISSKKGHPNEEANSAAPNGVNVSEEPAGRGGSLLASAADPSEPKDEPKDQEEQKGQELDILDNKWGGPVSEARAMAICQTDAKHQMKNPATVDFPFFGGRADRVDENGNLITIAEFTARNDFNVEQNYIAVCQFKKSGNYSVSVSRA